MSKRATMSSYEFDKVLSGYNNKLDSYRRQKEVFLCQIIYAIFVRKSLCGFTLRDKENIGEVYSTMALERIGTDDTFHYPDTMAGMKRNGRYHTFHIEHKSWAILSVGMKSNRMVAIISGRY